MTASEVFTMVGFLFNKGIIDENMAVLILYKFAENFILNAEKNEEPF